VGLSKTARIEARTAAEALAANRRMSRLNAKKVEEARARDVATTLAKYESPIFGSPDGRRFAESELGLAVGKLAPRLLENPPYVSALQRIAARRLTWIRDLKDWVPRGKGSVTVFRSLAEHLFSKYKTPALLWSAFFERDTAIQVALENLVISIAGGNSFYEEVKTGGIHVPLTRKMCHEVLASSSDLTFLQAIRRVQIDHLGGDRRLWKAWLATRPGRSLGTEVDETFWNSVLNWLAQNPMLDRTQVSPLCDYITTRRNENRNFSMKGRAANLLIEGMEAWHAELQAGRAQRNAPHVPRAENYLPSGFRGAVYDRTREGKGGKIVEIWKFEEILTLRDLTQEGRAMHHCVASYAASIERREISIWSLSRRDNTGNYHALTIEVRNSSRSVVQARGVCNKLPSGPEANVLAMWAQKNDLTVTGRW